MRHRLLGALIQKHQIQPIDSLLADPAVHDASFQPQEQLFPNWWRELSWYGDKIYGYPYTGLTAYLCYRKDLLDDPENRRKFKARYHREMAVPANWKEYMQLAEFFTRPGEHFYGTYISGKQGLALWYEWLNFVYSFGGDILDTQHGWEYGDIVVNSPQNVAATEQYVKLIPLSPPDTLSYGWNEAQAALQQGHAFMGLLWSDQAYLLEDHATSKVAGKIGYSLIPTNTSQPSQPTGGSHLPGPHGIAASEGGIQVHRMGHVGPGSDSTNAQREHFDQKIRIRGFQGQGATLHAGFSGKCSRRQGETDHTRGFPDDGGGGTPSF